MAQWIFRKGNIWRCLKCRRSTAADNWGDEELPDMCQSALHIHRIVQCPNCYLMIDICENCCVKDNSDADEGDVPGTNDPDGYEPSGT